MLKTSLSEIHEGFDDINHIVAHPKDSSIAVGDDSGAVTIVPVTPGGVLSDNASFSRHRKLSRVHTSIVNAIAYRKPNSSELVSGGFDCVSCVWDVARGRPSASVRLEHVVADDTESAQNQVLNPPFVHAVEYVCGGRGVLCALGDGTV